VSLAPFFRFRASSRLLQGLARRRSPPSRSRRSSLRRATSSAPTTIRRRLTDRQNLVALLPSRGQCASDRSAASDLPPGREQKHHAKPQQDDEAGKLTAAGVDATGSIPAGHHGLVAVLRFVPDGRSGIKLRSMRRRRDAPIFRTIPPSKLYLDEVSEIVEILRQHTLGDVQIATDDYEADDVDDLRELGLKKIHSLDIESQEPHVWVSFAPGTAMIQSPDSSAVSRGIVAEIEEALQPRRRNWFWQPRKKRDKAGREQVMNYSTIMLKNRAEAESFFKRKQDDILLLVVGAIVGGAVTVGVDLLFR
jgi:hypothetical protein